MKEKMKWLLLGIILIVAPLWKGLFFYGDMLIFMAITVFLIGIDYYLMRSTITRGQFFKIEPPFLAGSIMILTYVLTYVLGSCVNVADTIMAIVKILYMIVIFTWTKTRFSKEEQKRIISIYAFGAFIGASVAIMAVSGIINLPDAFLDTRFTGTFQYANAFAAYLMIGIIFTGYLFEMSVNKKYKLGLAAMGFGQFLVFVFTYSRGAWLILPIGLLLMFIAVPWKNKISMLFYYVGQLLITVLISKPFIEANTASEVVKPETIGLFILGMVAFVVYSGMILILIEKFSIRVHHISKKTVVSVCVISVILMVLIASMGQALSIDLRGSSNSEKTSVTRIVKSVEPNFLYTLDLKVNVVSDAEFSSNDTQDKLPLWSVSVQSIDHDGGIVNIPIEADFSGVGNLEIPVQTLENTDQLRITFSVGHPNMKVSMDNAVLKDDEDKILKRIKLSYRFVPEFIIARLDSINLNEKVSVGSRLTTYKDTMTIFKTQPLIGSGGGAWTALYPKYQSELYYTAVVHNYLAQIMLEMGVFGTISLAIIVLGILYAYVYSLQQKKGTEAVIAVALIVLLGHSLIDFDLSYLSLMLMLWVLMGTLTYPKLTDDVIQKEKRVKSIIMMIMMVMIVLVSGSFYFAEKEYNKAVKYKLDHSFDQAIVYYEKAVRMNPFKANYRYELADMLHTKTSELGDLTYAQRANDILLTAYNYAPYDLNVLKFMIDNNIIIGDFDRTLELSDEIVRTAPLRQEPYDTQLEACLIMGDYFVNKGDLSKGANYYRYPEMGLMIRYQKNNNITQKVLMSDPYMDRYERMHFFYRNLDNRERLVRSSALNMVSFFEIDVDQDQIPDDWKSKGDQIVKSINLEPNKFYEIQFHTADTNPEALLKFESKPGTEDEIVIDNAINSGGVYIMAIKTSANFEASNHQFSLSKESLELTSALEVYNIQ